MSPTITRTPRGYRLHASCLLASPIDDVFPFFADAFNLERLTPPFLRFEILTPPPLEMREALLIDYRIRLGPFPMRWRTEIAAWEPPHRFVRGDAGDLRQEDGRPQTPVGLKAPRLSHGPFPGCRGRSLGRPRLRQITSATPSPRQLRRSATPPLSPYPHPLTNSSWKHTKSRML